MSVTSLPYHLVDNQEAMRNRILLNAIYLFSMDSFHNVSLDKIARACGIRKQSVLHHFSSKLSIVIEAIETISQYHQAKLTTIMSKAAGKQMGAAMDDLAEMIRTLLFNAADGHFMCSVALHLKSADENICQVTRQYFQTWQNALTQLLSMKRPNTEVTGLSEDILSQLVGAITLGNVNTEHHGQLLVLERLRNYLTV